MASLPPSGTIGSPHGSSGEPDLNAADWQAAAQRLRAAPEGPRASEPPGLPVDLAGGSRGTVGAGPGGAERSPARDTPAWQKQQRLIKFTRGWAVVKMSISVASTWLTMTAIHAKLGETVSAYGVVCFWWAIGPHWRKRCFGPGQQLEPDLYDVVVKWCWRIGTVLVVAGATLYLLQLS